MLPHIGGAESEVTMNYTCEVINDHKAMNARRFPEVLEARTVLRKLPGTKTVSVGYMSEYYENQRLGITALSTPEKIEISVRDHEGHLEFTFTLEVYPVPRYTIRTLGVGAEDDYEPFYEVRDAINGIIAEFGGEPLFKED